jgi:hypothetical protein
MKYLTLFPLVYFEVQYKRWLRTNCATTPYVYKVNNTLIYSLSHTNSLRYLFGGNWDMFLLQNLSHYSCFRTFLWSNDQSSWLQIQRSRARVPSLPIVWEVVSLKSSPLSLLRINEELFEIKSSYSNIKKNYLPWEPPRWQYDSPLHVKVDINLADKRRPFGR